MQRGRRGKQAASGAPVPVILITYATTETTIREALEAVVKDGYIAERPQVIRIERD
jgi:homoserine dehydrogenase